MRAWARARRLDSQAWGFPGGTAWALLVAWAVEGAKGSDEDLLAHVFERLARNTWPDPLLTASGANATRALTRSTRAVLERELATAALVARRIIEGGRCDELAAPPEPRGECTHVLHVSGDLATLQRNGVGIVLALERARGVRSVRPYAARGSKLVAIGLAADDERALENVLETLPPALTRRLDGVP